MSKFTITDNNKNVEESIEEKAMRELKECLASIPPEELLTEEEAMEELDAEGADLLVYESNLNGTNADNICEKLGVDSVSDGFRRLDSFRYTHAIGDIKQKKKESIINPDEIITNRFLSDLYGKSYNSELRFDKKSMAERAGVQESDIAGIDTDSVISYDRIGEAIFSLLSMKAQLAELNYKEEHDYPLSKAQKKLKTFLMSYLRTPMNPFAEYKLDVCCVIDFLLDDTLQEVYFKILGDENSRIDMMKNACERIRHIKLELRNGTFIEIEKTKDEYTPLDLAALEIMKNVIVG